MTDFDIRKAIRSVIDDTDLASPDDIAAKVVGDIPAKALRDVAQVLLREYVRIELTRERMHESPRPMSSRSSKVSAIRTAASEWARRLRERVYVGDAEWKLLGECTYENLQYLAADRHEHAARNLAAAIRFEVLADALQKHGVEHVADLPSPVLDEAGEVAA